MNLFPIVLCASLASMVLAAPVPGSRLEKRCIGGGSKSKEPVSKDKYLDPGLGYDYGAVGLTGGGTGTSKVLSCLLAPVAQIMTMPAKKQN